MQFGIYKILEWKKQSTIEINPGLDLITAMHT